MFGIPFRLVNSSWARGEFLHSLLSTRERYPNTQSIRIIEREDTRQNFDDFAGTHCYTHGCQRQQPKDHSGLIPVGEDRLGFRGTVAGNQQIIFEQLHRRLPFETMAQRRRVQSMFRDITTDGEDDQGGYGAGHPHH